MASFWGKSSHIVPTVWVIAGLPQIISLNLAGSAKQRIFSGLFLVVISSSLIES